MAPWFLILEDMVQDIIVMGKPIKYGYKVWLLAVLLGYSIHFLPCTIKKI